MWRGVWSWPRPDERQGTSSERAVYRNASKKNPHGESRDLHAMRRVCSGGGWVGGVVDNKHERISRAERTSKDGEVAHLCHDAWRTAMPSL